MVWGDLLSHTAVLRYVIVIIHKYCVDKTNVTDINKQYGVQWQRVLAENNLSFAADKVDGDVQIVYNSVVAAENKQLSKDKIMFRAVVLNQSKGKIL